MLLHNRYDHFFCKGNYQHIPQLHEGKTWADTSPFIIYVQDRHSCCQGCAKKIALGQLCVKVKVIYSGHQEGRDVHYMLPVSSCLDITCLSLLLRRDRFVSPLFERKLALVCVDLCLYFMYVYLCICIIHRIPVCLPPRN